MNIDKIKWMVDYAEGCRLQFDGLVYLLWVDDVNTTLTTSYYSSVFYPHLLTRTIEGIEKNHDIELLAYWNKSGKCYESQVFKTESDFPDFQVTYTDCTTIDEAKMAAIDYVYKQESNNENNM